MAVGGRAKVWDRLVHNPNGYQGSALHPARAHPTPLRMPRRPASPVHRRRTRTMTSVCAGHRLGGAPRRNRTGDPILTMNRRPSAVLSGIFAGHSVPQRPQLWGQLASIPGSSALTHSLQGLSIDDPGRDHRGDLGGPMDLFPGPSRGPGRSAWGATEVATLRW
jgi:hypothetical protein